MPEDFDTIANRGWGMAERVGMQIAELPIKVREMALAGAEHCLREAGNERGVAGQLLDRIVNLQMRAIRQIVTDIDVGEVRRVEGHSPSRRSSESVYTALAADRLKDFWRE
jgi:hypothetical protein